VKRLDIPIQVLCLCNETGDVYPVRFRFEDKNGAMHICKVRQIISIKHSELAGIDAIIFQCAVQIGKRLVTVWLRYTVMSRKWLLLGIEV